MQSFANADVEMLKSALFICNFFNSTEALQQLQPNSWSRNQINIHPKKSPASNRTYKPCTQPAAWQEHISLAPHVHHQQNCYSITKDTICRKVRICLIHISCDKTTKMHKFIHIEKSQLHFKEKECQQTVAFQLNTITQECITKPIMKLRQVIGNVVKRNDYMSCNCTCVGRKEGEGARTSLSRN